MNVNIYLRISTKSMGLSFLWDEIQKEFYEVHKLPISQEQAQKLFERGRITILQKEYTLSTIEEKVSSYCDKIQAQYLATFNYPKGIRKRLCLIFKW